MRVSSYLKDKRNKIESKYHQITNNYGSTYGLIHQKTTSKFHRDTTEIKIMSTNIKQLMKKSYVLMKI